MLFSVGVSGDGGVLDGVDGVDGVVVDVVDVAGVVGDSVPPPEHAARATVNPANTTMYADTRRSGSEFMMVPSFIPVGVRGLAAGVTDLPRACRVTRLAGQRACRICLLDQSHMHRRQPTSLEV